MPERSVIGRPDALRRGLKRYEGKPCPLGHGVRRYVINSECVECSRLRTSLRPERVVWKPEYGDVRPLRSVPVPHCVAGVTLDRLMARR